MKKNNNNKEFRIERDRRVPERVETFTNGMTETNE